MGRKEGKSALSGAPAQLSQRESQGLKLVAKVLGHNEKASGSALASPFGRGKSAAMTERAHAVRPVVKVLGAMRDFPGAPEAPS